MNTIADNLNVCAACSLRQYPCSGRCACKEDGRDVIEHAKSGECPKQFYTLGIPPEHRLAPPSPPQTCSTCGRPAHRPKPPKIEPIPVDQWPLAAKLAAKARQPDDKGLGDVIARMIGAIGGDTLAGWFTRLTGKDCGCGDRKAKLNQLFPFTPQSA